MAHLSKNNLTRFLRALSSLDVPLPRLDKHACVSAKALSPGNFLCIHSILRHIYDAATTEQRVLL